MVISPRCSWYISFLCAPGGPTFAWRVTMGRGRWRPALVELERLPIDNAYPAPSIVSDGRHGANLYRRNILPIIVRRTPPIALAHAPVQLIIPDGDRFNLPELLRAGAADRAGGCALTRWPARVGRRGPNPTGPGTADRRLRL